MGGTGLEPVTPSLSTRGDRSPPFAEVRSSRMATRFSLDRRTVIERERTPSVAIVATPLLRGETMEARGEST
jgi:hypothetical protein